jgi:hypothetical protein
LILPFQGTYLIRIFGYFPDGIKVDSFQATATQHDPVFFANPDWGLMSNSAAGKSWAVTMKYVGPETDYHTNWYTAYSTTLDTVYFALNFGFQYSRLVKGVVTSTTWSLNKDTSTLYPQTILSFGSSVDIGDNDNSQMLSSNQNKFRVWRVTSDTLILEQGASLTSTYGANWGWYWVLTPTTSFKK